MHGRSKHIVSLEARPGAAALASALGEHGRWRYPSLVMHHPNWVLNEAPVRLCPTRLIWHVDALAEDARNVGLMILRLVADDISDLKPRRWNGKCPPRCLAQVDPSILLNIWHGPPKGRAYRCRSDYFQKDCLFRYQGKLVLQ